MYGKKNDHQVDRDQSLYKSTNKSKNRNVSIESVDRKGKSGKIRCTKIESPAKDVQKKNAKDDVPQSNMYMSMS